MSKTYGVLKIYRNETINYQTVTRVVYAVMLHGPSQLCFVGPTLVELDDNKAATQVADLLNEQCNPTVTAPPQPEQGSEQGVDAVLGMSVVYTAGRYEQHIGLKPRQQYAGIVVSTLDRACIVRVFKPEGEHWDVLTNNPSTAPVDPAGSWRPVAPAPHKP